MTRHLRQAALSGRGLCLWLLLLAPVAGCAPPGQGAGPGHRQQLLALTPEQELELGREAWQEITEHVQVVDRGPDARRVEAVGRRIAKAVEIEPLLREINLHVDPDAFQWEYHVIASQQINAFCLPGGKIGVFTGLLRVVQNDDQLAAVLGHEVAHALAHHVSERVARQQMGGLAILNLKFDREQESEADHIGVFLLTFAGYDPHEALDFWEEMQAVGERSVRLPEILSDHPSDERRIANMRQWVPLAEAAKRALDEGRVAPAPARRR